MAATTAATIEDVARDFTGGIYANALLEQSGARMTAAENRPMPMKTEARPDRTWYRVRVRGDGRRKLYRTNAELVQVKERAEAKLCGNLSDSNSRRNYDGNGSSKD